MSGTLNTSLGLPMLLISKDILERISDSKGECDICTDESS
jgi:hypothetical protein